MHQATETRTLAAAPGRGGGRARLVATLAVTQTIGYGVLYYAFAVVLHPIATDLRVSPATVTGALTVTVLISAVAAIPVGRWLHLHGGRGLMTAAMVADDAAWAEAGAADAIDYAQWTVQNARLAVLDTLDSRAYADEWARVARNAP
jgi:hypothetical protein